MDALEEYLKKLDESTYDHKDDSTINRELLQVRNKLAEAGNMELARMAELNRQVFAVQKSFNTNEDPEKGTIKGLSWQMSGTQTLEDGTQIPIYWPDVTQYSLNDFEYFEKRYLEAENLYVKTEYGLLVYFGARTPLSRHNDFKKQLFKQLFQLSKLYYNKAEKGGKENHYIMNFLRTLELAFRFTEKTHLQHELNSIVHYIFDIHQGWDITKEWTLRILVDLSGLMSNSFKLFNQHIDFTKVVEKNLAGAEELEKMYVWGAVYAVDSSIVIEKKRKNELNELMAYKARLYEKLAKDAEKTTNFACLTFAEDALRIYQQLKHHKDIKRLEDYYAQLRGKFHFSEIRQELPEEFSEDINYHIQDTIAQNDESGIINQFILTPWYDSIEKIKIRAEESKKHSVLLSILPSTIIDKFGNTVDVFHTEEEKEMFNFWSSYSFNFQIGTSIMHSFFIQSIKAGKLTYESTMSYLEMTWFNNEIIRHYSGREVRIKPIDTLRPGLKRIFEELNKYFADNSYQVDFITVIDSLALKIEGLLRYFCELLGIATFKTNQKKQKGAYKLVMEKLMDDLLADLAHEPPFRPEQKTNFDEEDRMFIKYVMTEKAGLNLRNNVAHGLMDVFDYSFGYVVVLFCIIMKLSKYKFVEIKGGTEDDSHSK